MVSLPSGGAPGRYRSRAEVRIDVADVGEFELIARVLARLPEGDGLVVGPGDDAAVVAAPDGRAVATTDLLVDGRHFDRGWSSAAEVGRKAAAQNLADVAAMGARPTALLVGLAAPPDLPVVWAEELTDGLAAECSRVGAVVAGGDVVRSPVLLVAVSALGDLGGREPVTRAGARPGDALVLVGRLGWAAAGLALLSAGDPDLLRRHAALVAAHRVPEVRYDAALVLADAGATAMIDISDGLVGDLRHVAERSGVRLELWADRLPVDQVLVAAAADLGLDARSWVAGGGDDHAFVASMPPHQVAGANRRLADLRPACPVAWLGRVVAGSGVAWGDRTPPGAGGHEHFRGVT